MSALDRGAQKTSHSGCFIPCRTVRRHTSTQNGHGRYGGEKQPLTLADFKPPFSRCAYSSLVTTLKLSWLHSVYFIYFLVALFQVLDQKGLTTKKINTTESEVGIIDQFNAPTPCNLLVFYNSPHGNEGSIVRAPWPRYCVQFPHKNLQ